MLCLFISKQQKRPALSKRLFLCIWDSPRSKNRPLDCFCPAGRTAGLRLAVTASACAPWAGLVLCDRYACSGSLFPPQAAVTSAASHSRPQWCTNGSSLKNKQ